MSRAAPQVLALAHIAERMSEDTRNNPAARRMLAEVNRLRSGAEALDNVTRNRNPLDTPAAHALKVAKMAKRLRQESNDAITRVYAALTDGVADAQKRIDAKVNLTPDAFAPEIRAAFRGLNNKQKFELLGKLVEENRGPELAAIVKAPSVLTGLADEHREVFGRAIVVKHAEAEFDEQTWLSEVLETTMAASKAAHNLGTSLFDPAHLQRIEREEEAANAAGDAFNQAFYDQPAA